MSNILPELPDPKPGMTFITLLADRLPVDVIGMVSIPLEPGEEAPFVVIWEGRVFRRWAGANGHSLGPGDYYRECTSAVGTTAFTIGQRQASA